MLDERWSSTAEEFGEALAKLLNAECTPQQVRAAEEATDGRDHALEAHLRNFGLFDVDGPPAILARMALELGKALAPTTFVETIPARVLLGVADTAYGLEGPVPASVASVAFQKGGDLLVAPLRGAAARSAAGDFLVEHAGTDGERVGDAADADRLRRLTRLLDAARLVGAGQALLNYGVAYAKERSQFGQIIGSYQGISHKLADAAIALDGAELLVRKAAFTASPDAGGDNAPPAVFAIMVRAKAIDAARQAATTVHQLFGGNGFAMEYDVQLYSRRIRNWALRLGNPKRELAELGRMVLDPARRDAIRHLWHYEQGMPLPAWAREADSRRHRA